MFIFRSVGTLARAARSRMPWKLMLAGAFVACALGAFAIGRAWATPPVGFTATNLVGPVTMDEFDTMAQADDWKVRLKAKGLTDVYVTHLQIVPGGHGLMTSSHAGHLPMVPVGHFCSGTFGLSGTSR